ncbi:MAG: vitamin B12 transporter [Roseivirga sp.]|jgi:vitamin B12 transporter
MKFKNLIALALLGAAHLVSAQEEGVRDLGQVVVTGTRLEIPIEQSGKMIYKISAADIEKSAGRSVADLLNLVPGIQIDGNFSTPGANLEYYVRGARSRYTLILIDGVPINDPTAISLFYDLRLLPTSQVESIEVLKGGVSALYGSNAAAGVISIKLKEAQDKKVGGSIDTNTGSFGSFGASGNLSGKSDRLKYFVSGSHKSVNGFSAAEDTDDDPNTQFDDDSFESQNALLKVAYQFDDAFSVDLLAGYDRFNADFDAFAFTDDPNNNSNNSQFRIGIAPQFKYNGGTLKLNAVYNNSEREFKGSFPFTYAGQNLQIDLTNEMVFNEYVKGIFGLNLQKLTDDSEGQNADFTILDPFASVIFETENGINLHFGVRLNTHSDYDNRVVMTVNPSWLIALGNDNKLKPFASLSSSYNTPSLYQINNDFFGNENLKPEETINFETGLSFYAKENLTMNFAFFNRSEQSPIDFVSQFDDAGNFVGGSYVNLAASRNVKGIEFDFNLKMSSKATVSANVSSLATDRDDLFFRIPKQKFGMGFDYAPTSTSSARLSYNYTGERRINSFSENTLEAFGLVDLSLRQQIIASKLSVYGSLNNVLDTEYIGVLGFETMGRNFTLGVSMNF